MTLGQLLPLKVELGQGVECREGGEEVVATDAVSKGRGKARLCGGHADDQDKQEVEGEAKGSVVGRAVKADAEEPPSSTSRAEMVLGGLERREMDETATTPTLKQHKEARPGGDAKRTKKS